MTALYQRQATGEGQLIDVSMLESMLSLTLSELQLAQFPASYIAGRPVFGPIATRDGYVNLSVASERSFRNLAAACGRADWIDDPRFAQYMDRRAHLGPLIHEPETLAATLSTAAGPAGVRCHGVPGPPLPPVPDAMARPPLRPRGAV